MNNDWKEIHNSGQQNCGIFIHKYRDDIIMKCTKNENIVNLNNITNKLKIDNRYIFPYVYETIKIDNNYYYIMDKLNGDFTSLIFNSIPEYILKKSVNLNNDMKKELLKMFKLKIKSTMNNQSITLYKENILYNLNDEYKTKINNDYEKLEAYINDNINNIYDNLYNNQNIKYIDIKVNIFNIEFNMKFFKPKNYNSMTKEQIKESMKEEMRDNILYKHNFIINNPGNNNTLELLNEIKNKCNEFKNINSGEYNFFINKVKSKIIKIYKIIFVNIIKIKLLLLNNYNYIYNDNKLDNFGYKIIVKDIININADDDKTMNNDRELWTVNDMFHLLETYIIDAESGLHEIKTKEDKTNELKKIITDYNNYLMNYTIYGQYKISNNFNNSIINIKDLNSIELNSDETMSLLNDYIKNNDIFKILCTEYKIDELFNNENKNEPISILDNDNYNTLYNKLLIILNK